MGESPDIADPLKALERARQLFDEASHRVPLVRMGDRWAANVRFPRPGSWRLVVPNWGAPGYAIPPPVIRVVRVTR